MGKAPKRVRILVTDPAMMEWPQIKKWIEQGHNITVGDCGLYDGVLGPNCWMMTPELQKYLPQSLQAMRERRYGLHKAGTTEAAEETASTSPEAAI